MQQNNAPGCTTRLSCSTEVTSIAASPRNSWTPEPSSAARSARRSCSSTRPPYPLVDVSPGRLPGVAGAPLAPDGPDAPAFFFLASVDPGAVVVDPGAFEAAFFAPLCAEVVAAAFAACCAAALAACCAA